jgi:hypothetical protein
MDWKSEALKAAIQYGIPALCTVGVAGLSWLLKKLADLLNAKAKESKLAASGARIVNLMDAFMHKAAADNENLMRRVSADGVITPEEWVEVRASLLGEFKEFAGKNALAELQGQLGIFAPQLDTYLAGLIEKHVANTAEAPSPQ